MRIWDQVPPADLCNAHLLGEHRELHGLWNILRDGKRGYANHPETRRWVGHRLALFNRHWALKNEMTSRGFRHNSPLFGDNPDIGSPTKPAPWDDQLAVLRKKAETCGCRVPAEVPA